MNTDATTRTLSENLRTIRKSKGLSTVDVAQILGVSQAKISYIENCKGVLSARDVALLSRRLDVPVTAFFRGLESGGSGDLDEDSGAKVLIGHLVRFGAVLLAKPAGITLTVLPFEEVFARSLGFLDDARLHKGFCAAVITQASNQEINVDRIFAEVGNNPFLTRKAWDQSQICLKIIEVLKKRGELVNPRASKQIQKIAEVAKRLLPAPKRGAVARVSVDEILSLSEFVRDCLHAKK